MELKWPNYFIQILNFMFPKMYACIFFLMVNDRFIVSNYSGPSGCLIIDNNDHWPMPSRVKDRLALIFVVNLDCCLVD